MYVAVYLYPVRPEVEEEFAHLHDHVAAVSIDRGAVADLTFAPADLSSKYGLLGFDSLPAPPGTRWWLGLMLFQDRAHFEGSMAAFDADPEAAALYERFRSLCEPSLVFRGEFEHRAGGLGDPDALPG